MDIREKIKAILDLPDWDQTRLEDALFISERGKVYPNVFAGRLNDGDSVNIKVSVSIQPAAQ